VDKFLYFREHTIMEATFSVRSVPGLFNEDQLLLHDTLETIVKRVGVWYETAGTVESVEGSIVRSW
jgi:hypothetical protein